MRSHYMNTLYLQMNMFSNESDLSDNSNAIINIDRIYDPAHRQTTVDESPDETVSIASSLEIRDAAINESWDWASVQRRLRGRQFAGGGNSTEKQINGGGRTQRHRLASTRLNIGTECNEEPIPVGGFLMYNEQQQKKSGTQPTDEESWVSGLWRWWNERAINTRLAQYDENERQEFIAQRFARVASIYADECIKTELTQLMICSRTREQLQREDPRTLALRRKYGHKMAEWLAMYSLQMEQHSGNKKKPKKASTSSAALKDVQEALMGKKTPDAIAMKDAALERSIQADVDDQLFRKAFHDPLMGWFRQRQDVTGRMMARIQNLAASICQQVAWSFLIEPGRPKTDLSRFYAEFDLLENFFDKVELTPEECSQKSFDANCLFKMRNRKLVCVDWSRVRLILPLEFTQDGIERQQFQAATILRQRPQSFELFDDILCPRISLHHEFSHADFINATRVKGGPLQNEFILTQAPLQHTIADFWRMVWQERSEFIYQLCECTISPAESNGPPGTILDQLSKTHSPFYWPRYEGDVLRFGRLHVRNLGIDMATDPLFTVTQLELWIEEEDYEYEEDEYGHGNGNTESDMAGPSTKMTQRRGRTEKFGRDKSTWLSGGRLRIQHWQWDWRAFHDFHWPFRLLLRSRHSKRPTILMCADGCGRSGTLALIEIFLMQLLRGAVSFEYPMLTAAVFLRLQRRHAVANHMQWLFAYRCILHWLQPFVISWYHRAILGYTFSNHGMCAKYTEIVQAYAHKKNLLI